MASGEEERATERKPVVLIVDDEPQIIEFLRMGFDYEGFSVCIARTGPEALQSVTAQHPDMVILDVMLPGLNGLEVAQQIRKAHDTCIIMLTAKEDVDDRVAGLDMGADDYVTKPFVFKELMARVRAVLRRRGLQLGELLTRNAILARIWGYNYASDDNVIEVYVRHLREKLNDNPPQLLQTVRGVGYVLRG